MLFKSIILDHCWACKTKEGLHNHHVIPQAYGGVDGPLVTLCGTHHTLIHEVALKNQAEWTTRIPKEYYTALSYLVWVIAEARAKTKHLAKPMQLNHKLTNERSLKLRELKLLLGQKSISSTLDLMIDRIYDQCTQLKQ